MKIVLKKESYTYDGITKDYTSARLNSKFAFTYGRVDVRAKLPSGSGVWPAIWTLGTNIGERGTHTVTYTHTHTVTHTQLYVHIRTYFCSSIGWLLVASKGRAELGRGSTPSHSSWTRPSMVSHRSTSWSSVSTDRSSPDDPAPLDLLDLPPDLGRPWGRE